MNKESYKSPTHQDIENSFNVKKEDMLKISKKDIEIKLMNNGTLYKEVSKIVMPDKKKEGWYFFFPRERIITHWEYII